MDERITKRIREGNGIEDATYNGKVIEYRRWEDLPINCLVDVFMRLGLDDMALGVPFVCKSWYEASLDPSCWSVLNLCTINPCPGSRFSERFKHDYRLDVFTMRGFLKFIINRSHKVATRIILSSVHMPPLQDLFYILDECPKVKMYRYLESRRVCVCINFIVSKLKEMTC